MGLLVWPALETLVCPFSSCPGTQTGSKGKPSSPRVSSKLCSGHCSPSPLSLPQQLQRFVPRLPILPFPEPISTPALSSPDWDVLFPEMMAQLRDGLAWPKLTGFCLSWQGGHMLTPLPAATPMKPGSAVSTCVLSMSLRRALSVPWLGVCSLPGGGGTVGR